MEIQPQFVTLGKLLSDRLFRIPQYQRAYSWQEEHREALFNDILHTWQAGPQTTHFLATVVGLRREKKTIMTNEHFVVEVVDGQQRLTTLIILIKAIAIAIDRHDQQGKKVGQELDETLVKPDKASLLLLQTNHDTSNYFADYLRGGKHPGASDAKTVSDRQLLKAMDECEEFVDKWLDNGDSLIDLVSLLKNRLTFIFHEISDEALVYTVFEVLNSRGLEVSWFDRLKSMLMANAFELDGGNKTEIIDEVHTIWTKIYRCVGLRLGLSTESLRFAATLRAEIRPNKLLSEDEAAELLASQAKGGPASVIETTKWLHEVTEAVDRLTAHKRRHAVTRILQARFIATAIMMSPVLEPGEKEILLMDWENIMWRIYGLWRQDARTAVGDCVRLSWAIIHDKLDFGDVSEQLEEIGNSYPVDDELFEFLRKVDSYNDWHEQLRYLFYRYEEFLAREAGQKFNNAQWDRIWEANAADSIEHILAQSRGSEDTVHRLGNLVVLPPKLNSKLGNKLPKEKAEDYTKTGLLVAQQVVPSLAVWKKKAIEDRGEFLFKWIKKEWDR